MEYSVTSDLRTLGRIDFGAAGVKEAQNLSKVAVIINV
jgi:hypothetical protein